MAERRMFAKSIIDSDAFLDMPVSARLLYYDLGMRGDDDGFVNSPRKIMRVVGASYDDMKLLIAKKFIIPFDNGVVVIKHWRIHNYIQRDRYKETNYKELKAMLAVDENGAYKIPENTGTQQCIQDVYKMETQVRLGKDRIELGKDSLGEDNCGDKPPRKRFVQPTLDEVIAYCAERKNAVDPEKFIDHYTANGWVQKGGQKIKDWKAAVRTWEKSDYNKKPDKPKSKYVEE